MAKRDIYNQASNHTRDLKIRRLTEDALTECGEYIKVRGEQQGDANQLILLVLAETANEIDRLNAGRVAA